MKRLENTSHSSKGFTLVELVVCMVILGIISTVVLAFLSNGTKFFVETSARTEISVLGRNLSLRLERHLANALPYSYDVSSDKKSIDFLEVVGQLNANHRHSNMLCHLKRLYFLMAIR